MRNQAIALAIMAILLTTSALSLASASATIHFIPIGGTITGTAPILTSSPANCILSEQSAKVTANDMYLIVVVDEATKNAGGTLTIEQTDATNRTLTKVDHLDLSLTDLFPVTGKFPPTAPSAGNSTAEAWPGCNSQYNLSPMQGFLGSENVYYKWYNITDVLLGGKLVAGQDQDLTMTVSSSGNFKIVVLLMAHSSNADGTTLDLSTPVTDTPLITTPEITTLVLIPVALGAVAIYAKKKQKAKA